MADVSADLAAVWPQVLRKLLVDSEDLKPTHAEWLRRIQPLALVAGTAVLSAPNEYAKKILEGQQLKQLITDVLSHEFGHPVGIAIAVASGGEQDPSAPPPPVLPEQPQGGPDPYDEAPRMRRAYQDQPDGGTDDWSPRAPGEEWQQPGLGNWGAPAGGGFQDRRPDPYPDTRDGRDNRDNRDSRDPRDDRGDRGDRDPRDQRDPRLDGRDHRDPRDPRGHRDDLDHRDGRGDRDRDRYRPDRLDGGYPAVPHQAHPADRPYGPGSGGYPPQGAPPPAARPDRSSMPPGGAGAAVRAAAAGRWSPLPG